VYRGLFSLGTTSVRMSITPGARAAPPIPATVRPRMNMIEEFAREQIREPTEWVVSRSSVDGIFPTHSQILQVQK
jgi:hypothetical protein